MWRDAQWAGAEVDVPIHLYSLWSDTVGSWPSYYATQPEVLAYWNTLIDKHHLRSRIILNTEYVESAWIEKKQHHEIKLRRRDGTTYTHNANVIISANGPLSQPEIPKLDGLSSFQGQYFHNLRWDPDVRLEGKNVAVIGNGSSGIQIVVSHLLWIALKTAWDRNATRHQYYSLHPQWGLLLPQRQDPAGTSLTQVNYKYSALTRFLFDNVPLARRLHRFLIFVEVRRSIEAFLSQNNDRWRARPGPKVPPTIDNPTKDERELLKYLEDTAPAEYLE